MLMLPLGERLRAWRMANRVTAVQVAEQIGVSKVTIWYWERTNRHPNQKFRPVLEDLISRPYGAEKLDGPVTEAEDKSRQLLDEIWASKERIATLAGVRPSNVVINIAY